MPNFRSYLQAIKREIVECSVGEVKCAVDENREVALLDVRERDEYVQGHITGAIWIPRGRLELQIEKTIPRKDMPVIAYCGGGTRSALATHALMALGYTDVKSMAGGFRAWKSAGFPVAVPTVMNAEQELRYARHVALPEVSTAGQMRLLKSRVLCVGAGGLGSPVLIYLAAAGVGTIGIVDHDVVDLSNLQRQIVHRYDRLGLRKVDSAQRTLAGINPDVQVIPHPVRLTAKNVLDILPPYDVIVDGTDNFPTRYLLNDASLKLGKPVVRASIYRFEGQVTVFMPGQGPCYRCLFPTPPPAELAPSCQDAGVLGVLCGIIGSLQASETIKLLLGQGQSLIGRLLIFDALKTTFREITFQRNPSCPTCGDGVAYENIPLMDYDDFCSRQ